MTAMTKSQIHVGCLVSNTVLGKEAKPFQKEVERLIRNNGPEWTTTRLKAIWTAANHLRNGNPQKAQQVYRNANMAYHKTDMTPKGPFRIAVRRYIHAQRPSVIRRHAAVLRFYTCLVLPELSEKQSLKAYHSITDKPSIRQDKKDYLLELLDDVQTFGESLRKIIEKNNWQFPIASRRQVKATLLSPNTYKFHTLPLDREDRKVPLRSLAASLMTEGYIPEGLEYTDPFPLLRTHAKSNTCVGKIGVIQEQGCKARVVAMPSARLQYAFKPLHDTLYKVSKVMPQSVIHDQEKAVYGILDFMNSGASVYSTDLSSATDRFPYIISYYLLVSMGLKCYADALRDIVENHTWSSPWGEIKYGTGQPMGLLGSFPLFHLSNMAIAYHATKFVARLNQKRYRFRPDLLKAKSFKLFPNGSTYYVLGDDIVFSDEEVERIYRFAMECLGVGISEEKSFSGRLSEFAGFIMTESQGKPFAFQPYKTPSGDKITNPINFMAALGSNVKGISKYWERQCDLFQRTWSDRKPGLTPWFVQEDEDPPSTQWDVKALDNEFNYLTLKYSNSAPRLNPSIRYSDGLVRSGPSDDGFTIQGLSRDTSKDVPSYKVESNRVALGATPKHPRRTKTPIQADPLMKRERLLKDTIGASDEIHPSSPDKGEWEEAIPTFVPVVEPLSGKICKIPCYKEGSWWANPKSGKSPKLNQNETTRIGSSTHYVRRQRSKPDEGLEF